MTDVVSYDDLDYSDDCLYLLKGNRFTGIAVQRDNDGRLVCEGKFLDGKEHGVALEYFSSGRVKREMPYYMGVKHGVWREWHPNGKLKTESQIEFDILMESRCWNELGRLDEHFVRDPADEFAKIASEMRKRYGTAP